MSSRDPHSSIRAASRRVAISAVKSRARHFVRRPATLDLMHPGLGSAPPQRMIAIGMALVERETTRPPHLVGFGGEIGLVNARAIILLGRALRRHATESSSLALL